MPVSENALVSREALRLSDSVVPISTELFVVSNGVVRVLLSGNCVVTSAKLETVELLVDVISDGES